MVYVGSGNDVLYAQYMGSETGPNEPEALAAIKSFCPSGTLP